MKISLLSLAFLFHILILTRVDSAGSVGHPAVSPALSPAVSPSPTDDIPLPNDRELALILYQWGHYIVEIFNGTSSGTGNGRGVTIFVPIRKEQNRRPLNATDPSEVFYHVVPNAYSISDLKTFKNGTRFPTLVQNKSILVTCNNKSNFTIDNIPITRPNILSNGAIAVHGLPALLDYKVYGGNASVPLPTLPPPPPGSRRPPPPSSPSPSSSTPPPSSPSSPPPPPQHFPTAPRPLQHPSPLPSSPTLPPKFDPAPQPSQRSAYPHPSTDSSNALRLGSKFSVAILAIRIVMGVLILS